METSTVVMMWYFIYRVWGGVEAQNRDTFLQPLVPSIINKVCTAQEKVNHKSGLPFWVVVVWCLSGHSLSLSTCVSVTIPHWLGSKHTQEYWLSTQCTSSALITYTQCINGFEPEPSPKFTQRARGARPDGGLKSLLDTFLGKLFLRNEKIWSNGS